MLSSTLRALEHDGIVTRTVHPTLPPRVEYALTGIGRTLLDVVKALGPRSRQPHDAHRGLRRRPCR
ncbi:winged helix-turn-helix transcriptional regulator [Streptomyces sp. NPDC002004]